MQTFKLIVFHIITPIFFGGLIYISFRDSSLRLFNWFDFIGLHNPIYWIRNSIHSMKIYIPSWVYFSLPDGLWIYSFTAATIIYWKNDFQKTKLYLIILFMIVVLLELLQAFKILSGTFDILDLISMLLGFLLSKIIIINKLYYR